MSKGKKKDDSEKENLVKVIDDNVAIIKDTIQKISAVKIVIIPSLELIET